MSRVGKRILTIDKEVSVSVSPENLVTIKGPRGELSRAFSPLITIKIEDDKLTTHRANEEKHTKQLHGTTNSLIAAMLIGVLKGFEKNLIIKGVGYKAAIKGNQLEVSAGYSHPFILDIPQSLKIELPKPTEIKVSGNSKQEVGEFAAIIRKIRKPNPYSGKGIMYSDERVMRKEGKAASK